MLLTRPALFGSMLLLGGCANMGYYLQAINGQMDVIQRAQPMERVLADPTADDSLKRRLSKVIRMRTFASKDLGLPDNGTFRRYADLQRPFVVWNVFAAPEFSTQPKEWCYALFGCASYRGYFSQDQAKTAAERLDQDGYDTYIGGVPAYSTLGWFDDPVLNTFVDYPEAELATLIFHELAHQVVYVSGDTSFNESFAVTVAQEGTRRWLARFGTQKQGVAFEALERRKHTFTALVDKYRERLAQIYTAALPDNERRARKAEVLRAMQEEFQTLKSEKSGFATYDKWFSKHLNNAQLASVSLYTQMVPAFQRLLASEGGDLPRFYHAVKHIAARPSAERMAILQTLAEVGSAATAVRASDLVRSPRLVIPGQ
jgi:predicted aminopeptidase